MPASITPYLCVRNAAAALDFYARAFGATLELRMDEPGTGRVGHAEMLIRGARIMLADEFPELDFIGPQALGGTTVRLSLDVDDVDAFTARAAAAGAEVLDAPKDEFHGERRARVRDPFGHVWNIATVIEEVTGGEMQRRYDAIVAETSDNSTGNPDGSPQ